ncbi:uncharacterized protein LOC129912261 [Episyrphus balteatus]|uniref:uncharacterized protein LOC129912261 n=1 Tax=Episyrphus balteatus TaxID=286459 RepID=UPI002486C437|nr:uncharacterized protein LOC129912261 [Episyrphus balteatus]
MDLTSHPSAVDIYQIHRTPFFRRLHRNNSDQFERLKKAYENIRSFDEKPLQVQVKKVRLGKLLRRIKDTLTKSKPKHEKQLRSKPKSQHQIRCEELAKARQKGSEYSRQNLNSISTPKLIQAKILSPQEEWLQRKSQLKRRLDYGNKKSEKNRSKIQRFQEMCLQYSPEVQEFHRVPRPHSLGMKEKLRKLLVRYLSEEKANQDVVNSLEEIAKTRNDLYWDLMGAISKQQKFIKRYWHFTKKLSTFAMRSKEQNQHSHVEIFESKTNIKPCGSEVCIRTYRYSDDDEYLPAPTESLLRMPIPDLTEEIPTHDEFREDLMENNSPIQHLHIAFPNHISSTRLCELHIPENDMNLSNKFGEIIRNTVRKESVIMLTNLEKAMKH